VFISIEVEHKDIESLNEYSVLLKTSSQSNNTDCITNIYNFKLTISVMTSKHYRHYDINMKANGCIGSCEGKCGKCIFQKTDLRNWII